MLTDILHRRLFGLLSLLAPATQGWVLRRYFDWRHRRPDPWSHGVDPYEQEKYLTTLRRIPPHRYRRILDAGCSEGTFTHTLARAYPDAEIIGLDISERALTRARARLETSGPRIRFTIASITEQIDLGRFDLVFCSEMLYYLGRDDRLRLASRRLRELVAPDGLLVLVHPWPEAQRLYRYLEHDPALLRSGEYVDFRFRRPFSVTLYRHAALAQDQSSVMSA